MVYKSSLGRGFNSSILNSYVLSVLICVSFSITLFVLSVIDAQSLKFLRFTTISFCKPIFIAVGKPFQIFNGLLIYVNEIKLTQEKNKELLEENKRLAKKLDNKNFLLLENHRLRNLLKIKDVDYVKKITSRILIDAYKDAGSLIYIDVGKGDGLKINDIVFNEKGLLGRIIELGQNSSKVLTIFDENSVIPVVSINSKKSFFLQGGKKRLALKHIEKKFDLKHGEIVVSTDAAGYFKEGIKIGRVVKTLNEVFVVPFAKKTDSIYVNVLIYDYKNVFHD